MIENNILECQGRIHEALARAGCPDRRVTLIAVTKNVPVKDICQAVEAGILDFGDNRVQEALEKHSALQAYASGKGLRLIRHMIGHLQTNKAGQAVGMFDLIHSVDSLKLAREIDKQALRLGKVQDMLLEVNVSQEKSKFGFSPQTLETEFEAVCGLRYVRVRGLMTVAPMAVDPQSARPVFRGLRLLKEKLERASNKALEFLSMGMSDDFEVAVEEGANMVRLGRAIFTQGRP
ncbi:MAG: YggS family pyridoxal phosphate-dependent enzyme [Candidatus Omnitrophota bacterium]